MNSTEVIRRFAQMANLSIAEALQQANLVDLAIAMVEPNVRDPKSLQTQESLLLNVCASTTNYWYQLSKSAAEPSGTFVGDSMRVQHDTQKDLVLARNLRDQWWSAASHLLEDIGDFIFIKTPEVYYDAN